MKKIFVVILLIGIIGFGSVYLLLPNGHKGFDIKIKNQTKKEISGLFLTYGNITSDIKIPTIQSGESYKFNVNPTEDFGENSMELYYRDQNGQIHKNFVFGYFEKGYYGEADITLKSIEENGKIKIKVIEKMFN